MITLNLACEFIPGYDLLTLNDRTAFEITWTGEQLRLAVGKVEAIDKRGLLSRLTATETRADIIQMAKTAFSFHTQNKDYSALINQIITNTERKKKLTGTYFKHLNNTCKRHDNPISILNLDQFNQDQAKHFSQGQINNELLTADTWLPLYEQALLTYIENNIYLFNGGHLPEESLTINNLIENSVSSLFSCKSFRQAEILLDQIADAHGVIQGSGCSTQNESSRLSWLDLYNYKRSARYVAEAKKTLYKFFQPFAPLWAEFYDITNNENNIAQQIVRTLIPFIIVAAVVILVAAPLSHIVISEIASIVVLIPTVYIGLLLATSYVTAKDSIYHAARNAWYGPYGAHEYTINPRMTVAFETEGKAILVQQFYVDEIKACEKLESDYKAFFESALLTELGKASRNENLTRLDKLKLEWIDIHSNKHLGPELTPQISLNRMRRDMTQESVLIKNALSQQHEEITRLVKETVCAIKAAIDETAYAPLFFKPACFVNKERAEGLNTKIKQIETRIAPTL